MKKQVVLADVLGWLREAMQRAKADPREFVEWMKGGGP
jgi:hypothetical protein